MVKKKAEHEQRLPPSPVPLFGTRDNIGTLCVEAHLLEYSEAHSVDYDRSTEFLEAYEGSLDTFNAYRREVERFLSWLWEIDKATLITMDPATFKRYLDFLEHLPDSWISHAIYNRFKTEEDHITFNPKWRPFSKRAAPGVAKKKEEISRQQYDKKNKDNSKKQYGNYILSQKSAQVLTSILRSYFTYLMTLNYITFNPVIVTKQKERRIGRPEKTRTIRRLTHKQWLTILDGIIEETHTDNYQDAERALFIFSAFYLMGVRISELGDNDFGKKKMNLFHQESNGTWWFYIKGKGNKSREAPVNDDMLAALTRYRLSRKLSSLPTINDSMPLIENFQEPNEGISNRMVRYIFNKYTTKAIIKLQKTDSKEAEILSHATAHWLRHTSISEQVEFRPKEHVKEDAGHADSKTTDNYISTFSEERHTSMQGLKLRKQ